MNKGNACICSLKSAAMVSIRSTTSLCTISGKLEFCSTLPNYYTFFFWKDTEDYRERAGGLEPSLIFTDKREDARSEAGSE